MDEANETVIVIDSQRSVSLNTTDSGSIVMTLEGPTEIAIVEIPREEAGLLLEDLAKRLS